MSTFLSNNIKPRRGDTVTFTNNVSIGGTVTYEDVTNVDSVGIITSQSGIKVGAGQSISPVSGTIAYYGDGSNLDGIESGVVNFVASGTIPNGKTVVIKDDGTVGIVTQTTSPAGFGTEVVFEENDMTTNAYCSVSHDTVNNKIVVTYKASGDSDKGKAVVGTVDTSDNSITFGTPVEYNSNVTGSHSAYVGNSKVVIAYQHGNSPYHGYAIVGTVSGTGSNATITFGTEVVLYAGVCNTPYVIYDPDNDKAVVLYKAGSPGGPPYNAATAVLGTVSGTGSSATINFGNPSLFGDNGSSDYFTGAYIGSSKIVVAYSDGGNSYYGTSRVGTVDVASNLINWTGSEVIFNTTSTGLTNRIPVISIGNNKVVIAYAGTAGSNYSRAKVGTVSGTSISFGSDTTFLSGGDSYYLSGIYDTVNDKVFIAYRDDANSAYGTSRIGTVDTSANTISFDSPVVFSATGSRADWIGVGYDTTNNKSVIAYTDYDNSLNYGTALVYSPESITTNLTSENYIGIAGESIANGATGKINITGGINSGQTGLTTAKKYYVAPTGILTTTAGTPSVIAGTSISDTKISIK